MAPHKNFMRTARMIAAASALCLLGADARFDGNALEKTLDTHPDFVDISVIPGIAIDLKYAGTDNVVGKNLYGTFNRAFLHKEAAEKLRQAARILTNEKPGWKIVVYDALRPHRVQKLLWEQVKKTRWEKYIADPAEGSMHNYGMAVDISLLDENGRAVDMGTKFDSFTRKAQPILEDKLLAAGKLTERQVDNRRLLRRIMTQAEFYTVPVEWWHFNAFPRSRVRRMYRMIE